MTHHLGILPHILKKMAEEFLELDATGFDVGAAVVGDSIRTSRFLVKANLVISGMTFAQAVLEAVGCTVTWTVNEGDLIDGSGAAPIEIGRTTGPICRLLQAERTALEVLHRASAVATITRECVDAAAASGWTGKIAGTRKTTPGYMRYVEKSGLLAGGADPHRFSLTTMCMLKDNHIDAANGDIAAAVATAKRIGGFAMKVEVECRSLDDALTAAAAGAEVVMLDNFAPTDAAAAAAAIKVKYPAVIVEVSGGITVSELATYLPHLGAVDIVSMGCLTQAPPRVDISLKVVPL